MVVLVSDTFPDVSSGTLYGEGNRQSLTHYLQCFHSLNYPKSITVNVINVIPTNSEVETSSFALICNTLQY